MSCSTPALCVVTLHPSHLANTIATLGPTNGAAPTPDELQDLLSQCKLAAYENGLWVDWDQVKLVHYFPHVVSQRERPLIPAEFGKIERFLWQQYNKTPKAKKGKPSSREARHANYEEERESMKQLGLAVGTFCITVHRESGHQRSQAGIADDFLGGTVQQTVLQTTFRTSPAISCLSTFVSTLFAAIDSKAYKKYREAYVWMARDLPVLQNLDSGNPMQCFAGYYIVLNLQTLLHRDCMDPRNGWVAMAVFGDDEGGELHVPDL
jgi:hypothetical protein